MRRNAHKALPDLILAQLDRRLYLKEHAYLEPSHEESMGEPVAGIILVWVFYTFVVLMFAL